MAEATLLVTFVYFVVRYPYKAGKWTNSAQGARGYVKVHGLESTAEIWNRLASAWWWRASGNQHRLSQNQENSCNSDTYIRFTIKLMSGNTNIIGGRSGWTVWIKKNNSRRLRFWPAGDLPDNRRHEMAGLELRAFMARGLLRLLGVSTSNTLSLSAHAAKAIENSKELVEHIRKAVKKRWIGLNKLVKCVEDKEN